jgi:hypothetical protein
VFLGTASSSTLPAGRPADGATGGRGRGRAGLPPRPGKALTGADKCPDGIEDEDGGSRLEATPASAVVALSVGAGVVAVADAGTETAVRETTRPRFSSRNLPAGGCCDERAGDEGDLMTPGDDVARDGR